MRCVEIEAVPSVARLLDRLEGRAGRFVLEDVPAGKAIIGAEPEFVITARDGRVEVSGNRGRQEVKADPFEMLRTCLTEYSDTGGASDAPFAGGAVGCFSYDLGRSIEKIEPLAAEDVVTPDYALGFYDSALCVDSAGGRCTAVSRSGNPRALAFWSGLAKECSEKGCEPAPASTGGIIGEHLSCFGKQDYLAAIERVRDYIRSGDVCQVNLAQRFEADVSFTPSELYQALRRVNPAPNACLIEVGGPALVSASPETFLRYDPKTRKAVTRPIKGTRPRGRWTEEDRRLARELAVSEKDRAENVMIVDMLRNDLGRVAEYGSVKVPRLWDIEAHPTVFQMVSTVEARLAQDRDAVDLLKACFPGGSITGAPKIRAMQVIEELEPVRRGFYTGAAGYIDSRGYMDLNIVIRSFVMQDCKAYFHGGGGIVIDSDPEMEYQETLDKVAGLVRALRECGRER